VTPNYVTPNYGTGHTPWGNIDIGLAHFSGTSREPRLTPGANAAGNSVLIPHYELIDQTSADVQLTTDAWLWKLEMIHRSDADKPNAT